MKNLYVCYSYYHVLITLLKTFNSNTEGCNEIIITDQIPNYKKLYNKLNDSKIFESVIMIDDQKRSKELFHDKTLINKINFVFNYKKNLGDMFSDINYKDRSVTIYFDRQHLSQFFILNCDKIILSEDGKNSTGAFAFRKNILRIVLEKLNLIIKLGGYPDSISTIECSSMDMLPYNLRYKYKNINFNSMICLENSQKNILRKIFSFSDIKQYSNACVILTQPYFEEKYIKEKKDQLILYKQIYDNVKNAYDYIYIKPHPRDSINYGVFLDEKYILDKYIPFELYKICDIEFKKYVTIDSTSISDIDSKKVEVLGSKVSKELFKSIRKHERKYD